MAALGDFYHSLSIACLSLLLLYNDKYNLATIGKRDRTEDAPEKAYEFIGFQQCVYTDVFILFIMYNGISRNMVHHNAKV